jgi:hypothetical protein
MSRSQALATYRRVRGFGFPRRYPIAQFPNNSLIAAFLGGQVAANAHGSLHLDAQAVSFLAMGVWAYLELAHGVNRFRQLLGLVYTLSTASHLARALGH